MNAFEIILAPFLFIVKELYLLSFQLTHNYGLSIVLLSFFISALILPIFILIENAKKKDDAIKLKMKPYIDEIKRCYKGQERFYYLKTLNRQYGYSPVHALIPILSLLIQIPFFIAAFQFLDAYEPLIGTPFLFIKDLSLPDGVFGTVNVLPIAMTLVNLLTAYFYTRKGNVAERRQMVIVAVVFLVLLFKLPAGLVLYWTMNNVFSFFRLFITNGEVFRVKKIAQKPSFKMSKYRSDFIQLIPKLKNIFIAIMLVGFFTQISWAFKFNFDDIYIRLVGVLAAGLVFSMLIGAVIVALKQVEIQFDKIVMKPIVFYSLCFISLYLFLGGILYSSGDNKSLLYISYALLMPLQLVGFVYFVRAIKNLKRFVAFLLGLVLTVIALNQLINIIAFLASQNVIFDLFNLRIETGSNALSGIGYAGFIFLFVSIVTYAQIEKIERIKFHKSFSYIYVLSVFYLLGFIFLWNPLSVFSSFPETFNFFAADILINNSPLFFVFLVILLLFYAVLPQKIKAWYVALIAVSAGVSFLHNTVLPIDMGSMHEGRFENPEKLNLPILYYISEGIIIWAIVIGAYTLFRKKQTRSVLIAFSVLNVVLIANSLYAAKQSGKYKLDNDVVFDMKNSISFSKTEQNVVFLIPDAFQGWNLNRMMKENKEIFEQLDGFVWYPNTVAISRVTNTSMAALLGGYEYTPDKLHADKSRTNGEKLSAAKQEFAEKVIANNYSFTSNKFPYIEIEEKYYDTFLPAWHEDWDLFYRDLGIEASMETGYTLLWNNALFFSLPYALKPKVYRNGDWLFAETVSSTKMTAEYAKYHFFRLLTKISNTKSAKGSFILLYSLVTHAPTHLVNADGSITRDVSPYRNTLWLMPELCKWFQWMKDNDVYDNTKIIIVSDHGGHWKHFKGDIDIDIPFENIDDEIIKVDKLLDLNPLLLVKDFNAKDDFSIDWRFLSNVDAVSIAFDENDPTKPDTLPDRVLPAFTSWWSPDMGAKNEFYLVREYKVQKSIFDANNWTLVKKHLDVED